MTCPNCGSPIKETDHYCSNCGFCVREYFDNQENTNHVSQTVKITTWISNNGMLIFVGALLLLILMSGSKIIGWSATFLALIIIYVLAINHQNEEETILNRRILRHVDVVGKKVEHGIVNSVNDDERPSPQQVKVKSQTGWNNFNLISIFGALISLLVVFYGPFASAMMGMGKSISIYDTLLLLAQHNMKYAIICYTLLAVMIGCPILIIMLTMSTKKHANRVALVLSAIETLVILALAVQIFYNSSILATLGSLDSFQNLPVMKTSSKIMHMFIGFGISSYLLLISSALTTFATWINRK